MKRIIAMLAIWSTVSWAVTDDGFTVTVLHNDKPVREFMENGKRRAAIPFGSEYKLRLKNTHNRRAVAKVFIDGTLATMLGDIVIPANDEMDLERFLDASLTEGKRFKFVRLDHPDVDDPTRAENGEVKVEFRLATPVTYYYQPILEPWIWQWNGEGVILTNLVLNCGGYYSTTVNCSATIPGATVAGGKSDQAFTAITMSLADEIVTVTLWLRGIEE